MAKYYKVVPMRYHEIDIYDYFKMESRELELWTFENSEWNAYASFKNPEDILDIIESLKEQGYEKCPV